MRRFLKFSQEKPFLLSLISILIARASRIIFFVSCNSPFHSLAFKGKKYYYVDIREFTNQIHDFPQKNNEQSNDNSKTENVLPD